MSTKQRLAEAIAALPDSLSIEEAVERLYRAFRQKQAAQGPRQTRRIFGAMRGQAQVSEAFFEPLPEEELRAWEG